MARADALAYIARKAGNRTAGANAGRRSLPALRIIVSRFSGFAYNRQRFARDHGARMTSGGFADAATGTGGASNGKTGSTGARPALMPRILAVDDDPTMHVYLRETLSRLEVDLRLAEDAAGFRALRAERTPDLSIIDVDLPDAGGHVLAQEIGASGEPMVFFSVLDTVAHRMRALEAGAMEYLVKPVSPREFVLRIANILDQTRRTAGPPPAPVSRLFAGCRFDPGPRRIAGPDGNACALTADRKSVV